MNVWYVNSILGTFRLEEENDAICGLTLCPDGVPELEPLPRKVCETPLLQEAEEQLNEYFAGARREFDLPLAPKGTPFQKAVWAEMNKIPYGETRTYGQLAAAVGRPKASRAVGGACHCNPIAILQPCHRVVGSTGKLTGYAYGVEMKQYLLEHFLKLDVAKHLVLPSSKQSKLKKLGFHTTTPPKSHNSQDVNVKLQCYFPYLLGFGFFVARFDMR